MMGVFSVQQQEAGRALIVCGEDYRAWHQAEDAAAAEALAATLNREAWLAQAAAFRFQRETAGVAVGGITVRTGRDDQAMLTGAVAMSALDPDRLIDWKGASGWVQIDRATLLAIAAAVGAHVQGCFSAERRVAERLAVCQTAADFNGLDLAAEWAAAGGP